MTGVNKILPVFSVHVSIFGQNSVSEDVHNNAPSRPTAAFVTVDLVGTTLCGRELRTSCRYFPHLFSNSSEKRHNRSAPNGIHQFEFRENRRKECCTLLVGETEVYRASACTMAVQSCAAVTVYVTRRRRSNGVKLTDLLHRQWNITEPS